MTPLVFGGMLAACTLWALAAGLAVSLVPPLWDAVARRYVASLVQRAEVLGFEPDLIAMALRAWGIVLGVVPFVVGYVMGLPLFALPAAGLVAWAPREVLGLLVERRERALRDQLPSACATLANKGRARLPLRQALVDLARDTPDPLRREFRRIAHALQGNHTLHDALWDAKRRLSLDCFSVFCELLLVNAASGGDYPAALDALAASLQEEQRLERLLASQTSSGRTAIRMMGCMLIGGFPLLRIFDPDNTALMFSTYTGQGVVLLILGLTVSALALTRMVTRTPR